MASYWAVIYAHSYDISFATVDTVLTTVSDQQWILFQNFSLRDFVRSILYLKLCSVLSNDCTHIHDHVHYMACIFGASHKQFGETIIFRFMI